MKRDKVNKGFAFKPDIDYIKRTMDMPVRSKLEWLEEINIFVNKALSKKRREIWEKFKRGEV
ncbi:MAG: hypothetical protein KKB22_05775 [Candidatus Omnitrophica bacterium]|nr:hypothetical protein [Candidatus Omnitrophota bacterium]